MTYIISTIIVLSIVLAFFGLAVLIDEELEVYEIKEIKKLEWYKKICVITLDTILAIFLLALLILLICFVRYCLLSIPFIKEFVTKMEWR